jgi:adenine deaminase
VTVTPDIPPYDRRALIAAALGDAELDLVLKNVTLVNVFTGETYQADIGISQGWVAHVTVPGEEGLTGARVEDRAGLFAIPGLIDTHVHIESSMVTPAHYAEAVLPHGTTTVLIDPHELGNVLGLQGVRYMVEASEDITLRVLTMAPSCVPSALGVETAGASFDRDEIAEMLTWPRVVGLAEVMDYPGVLRRDGRMMRLIEATEEAGGLIQGHGPGLTGRRLSAYRAAGIDSDHENRMADEALAKLRAGMTLEVRESSLSLNAAAMAETLRGRGYLPTVTLCSDDVTPEDLLQNGHIDYVARRLVEEGLNPIDVVRFATLNAANRLHRHDLGAIAPGRIADIALLSDLPSFRVEEVYRAGELVARAGRAMFHADDRVSASAENTVHLPPGLSAESFRLRPPGLAGKPTALVRVISWHPRAGAKTSFLEAEIPVRDGELVPPPELDGETMNTLAVIDRHAVHGGGSTGLVRGFGLRRGALGSTVSHDSHQLTVMGMSPSDMLAAARRLAEIGGGIVLVLDGQVLAEIPLPIAGLLAAEPAEVVAGQVAHMRATATHVGLPPDNSFMGIVSQTLAVSPFAKLSDLGLIDVNNQQLVPMVVP